MLEKFVLTPGLKILGVHPARWRVRCDAHALRWGGGAAGYGTRCAAGRARRRVTGRPAGCVAGHAAGHAAGQDARCGASCSL